MENNNWLKQISETYLRKVILKESEQEEVLHKNPMVHAAAKFLHSQLGPITHEVDAEKHKAANHPSHYVNALVKGLKDPMTTDIDTIVDAAHTHVIGGHHNLNSWAFDNLPPEDTMDYDDVDSIDEKGQEDLGERLGDHLHQITNKK